MYRNQLPFVALILAMTGVSCSRPCEHDLSEERKQQIFARIQTAVSLRYYYGDDSDQIERNSPAFDEVTNVISMALKKRCFTGLTGGLTDHCTFLGKNGEVLLEFKTNGGGVVVIDGVAYDTGPRSIASIVSEAISREIYFYPSGRKRAEGLHDKHEKNGTWTFYYEDGRKQSEGVFDHGRKVGEWITWDQDGNLMEKRQFGH